MSSGEKLDKDRFRRDPGRVVESCREVLRRVEGGRTDEIMEGQG